jgi:omega-amidase
MNVSLIQYNIAWHNPEANFEKVEQLCKSITGGTIVLPEMFSTGFTMKAELVAEPLNGASVSFLKKLANNSKANVLASVVIEESGKYYNRMFWVKPNGEFEYYDKKHLFTMAGEHEHYSAGTTQSQWEIDGWQCKPLVCYDLRFPVWARNTKDKPFDVLFYVANWPSARVSAWDALLKARAIENQCFVVGVNRVGKDGNDIDYNGHSTVIDPYGTVVAFSDVEEVLSIDLDKKLLTSFREKFPVLNDGDGFKLI